MHNFGLYLRISTASFLTAICHNAFALTHADQVAIGQGIDQIIAAEAKRELAAASTTDCRPPTEEEESRVLVERHFSNQKKTDVFAFFAMGGFGCGGNNWSRAIAIFNRVDGKFQLLAYGFVDGLHRRIEPGYIQVHKKSIYLRSDDFDDDIHMHDFGRKKVYVRVSRVGRKLKPEANFYLPKGRNWVVLPCPKEIEACNRW